MKVETIRDDWDKLSLNYIEIEIYYLLSLDTLNKINQNTFSNKGIPMRPECNLERAPRVPCM